MIRLRGVSKTFRLYQRPADRLLEWFGAGRRYTEFHALRNITLDVPRGRTVAIVGSNGAGKSTLLKLITGTLLPTAGTIEIDGRVAALLELGTGFHPEFSGRQNIHINGQLLGLTAEETARLEPEIIEFSELGPFIDQPIRTYSSGMVMRLGFSIAAAARPELLIVDEALSVGDARFSQKCIRRIREFRDAGATILFVSHDPGAVSQLCDEAVLLDRGEVRAVGLPSDILAEYNALLAAAGTGNVAMRISRASGDVRAPRRHGTFQALITRLELLDEAGRRSDVFHPGDVLTLQLRVDFLTAVHEPTIGFLLKDRLGLDLFGTNTALQQVRLGSFAPGEAVELAVRVPLRLGYGDYSLTVAVHDDETHLEACYEWTDNAAIFRVRLKEKNTWTGMVLMDPELSARTVPASPEVLAEALRVRFGHGEDPLPFGGEPPTPFLAGFAGQEEGTRGGACQMLPQNEQPALFVFAPQGPELALRVAFEGERPPGAGPVRFRLGLVGWGWFVEYQMESDASTLRARLPEGAAGALRVFELTQLTPSPTHPVALYACGTRAPLSEEDPAWPTTTPVKS